MLLMQTSFNFSFTDDDRRVVEVSGFLNVINEEDEQVTGGKITAYIFDYDANHDDFDALSGDTEALYAAVYNRRGIVKSKVDERFGGVTSLCYIRAVTIHEALRGQRLGLHLFAELIRTLQFIGSSYMLAAYFPAAPGAGGGRWLTRYFARTGAAPFGGGFYGLSCGCDLPAGLLLSDLDAPDGAFEAIRHSPLQHNEM